MSAGISTPTIRRLQAQKASAERWPNPNKEQIARDYAAEKLAEYVRRTLATAPELTDEQVTRIALLLKGGDAI